MRDYKNGYGNCPDCNNKDVMLIDTSDSDWTDLDEMCDGCIMNHADKVHREAQRAKRRQSDLSDPSNTHYERF